MASLDPLLDHFLGPLRIDLDLVHKLSRDFTSTFEYLAAESASQFLPTPISESILRPVGHVGSGRGGTNLRVGFVELLGKEALPSGSVRRHLEKSWPIDHRLKSQNADSLFQWIGQCIVEVVHQSLPLGVTFSFPMVQNSLSEAMLMSMGKGFAIESNTDLGSRLVQGYNISRTDDLPQIQVTAISNDSVSTLVSFIFKYHDTRHRRAAMGLILGTGCNATIPIRLSRLHPSKRPPHIRVLPGEDVDNARIAVNTEWSINGSAPPLRKLGLITPWDDIMDSQNEMPGFQPLEYMTAGRYLGELGRIIFVDYLTKTKGISRDTLPTKLLQKDSITTTFLSHYKPLGSNVLLSSLKTEFPESTASSSFLWSEELAAALYHIAKAIEVRAAGIIAAAVLALLTVGEEIPAERSDSSLEPREVGVGYTGGCIVHFQDYLVDCQEFLDRLVRRTMGDEPPVRIVLSPCHDGDRGAISLILSNQTFGLCLTSISLLAEADLDDARAAQLDLVSRSLPTAGPILEPEAPECGVLFATERKHHHHHHHHEDGDQDAGADDEETAPLLRARSSSVATAATSASSSAAQGAAARAPLPPFLKGTSRRRFWLIFAQVLTTNFISCFDSTIMASSHPVITSAFEAANAASWLSTAFLLTSTATQPLLGRLSDALGRKPLFVGCVAVFALATVWCACAGSIGSFILARAVCGVGAGGTMTLGAIITSDLVPIERRGAYQAYFNMTYGVGSSLGAALGGAMAESLGWRWEFGVQVPPLLLCLAISQAAIPGDIGLEGCAEHKSVWAAFAEFDTAGSLLLTVSVTFFILGLSLGGNMLPWSHPFVVASLCIFCVGFPVFFWVESRAAKPIVPLYLLRHSPRSNLIFSNALASVLSNAIFFNIPLFFQAVLLSSATDTGVRLVVPVLVASSIGAFTGFAITWTRRMKWPIVSGTSLYVVGCICLASLQRGLPPALYLLALVPFSLGQGLQFPGTTMCILGTSAQSEQAVVTSTLILWRNMGMVLGIAASSLVLQNSLLHYLNVFVHGELKEEVITRVRESVEAIVGLEQPYRDQVVSSYESALRLTFMCCVAVAVVSFLIVLPMKVPRLPTRKR
ncbi:hypothetical protein B0I35DRAFT_448087 [Stachybotrys elegans]|uniref:Major facilitator superfamily (MFS) profile domain-containing protein n=1 Tax=Stachybotrys elegans TaxID=80388 RepID=A0A8K0T3F7_9HYPO|nr:hypothetical protein B0I35DRAFT_448087 [Stachybotrys elegans]